MNFEEWKKTGPLLIKALRDRGEEDSFRKLLSDLYPKKAHFIYELFQNAEDVGASICKFSLTKKELVFEHDGRVFIEDDVIGITGIGNSTKKNDPTKIGEFGVGFKAVFAYTNTPEIHSGDFNFRIKDLLVIEDIDTLKTEEKISKNISRFRFPFNHYEKSQSEAYLEIKNALSNLPDNTLLFLSSIKKIEYSFEAQQGSLERVDLPNNLVDIVNTRSNSSKYNSSWLRFDKQVEIINEDIQAQKCRISLAFKLSSDDTGKKIIVPPDRGDVSIYFPAESEVSNLLFHIHAPFASTVARDCVRDSSSNNLLRDELVCLLIEAIENIKNYGYLDIDFLGLLPNFSDNLSDFYKPFRDEVIEAFRVKDLTPTLSGQFACSNQLYIGANDIQKIITDDDLSIITGYQQPLWCKNPQKNNIRSAAFLDDLQIDEWGYEELKDFFTSWSDDDEKKLQDWLTNKSDEQLFHIYSSLGKSLDKENIYYGGVSNPIIRSICRGEVELTRPSESFFPVDGGTVAQEIKYVKPEVYKSFGSKVAQKYAMLFLEEVGVRLYDQHAVVRELLNKYDGSSISVNEHMEDIRIILAYDKERPGQSHLFAYKKFILCDHGDFDSYGYIRDIFLDGEYVKTHLGDAKSIHSKRRISNSYKVELSPNEFQDFIKFLENYGAFFQFKIERGTIANYSHPERHFLKSGFGNESSRTIDQDYSIPNLRKYLKLKSIHINKLIWDCCINAPEEYFEAVYLRNAQNEERRLDSSLIYILKESLWVPDMDGNLLKPEFVSEETLHPSFTANSSNNFLQKIGFGFAKKRQTKEYESFKKVIESRGLSVSDVDQVLALMVDGLTLTELKKIANHKSGVLKPIAKVVNYDRRRDNILDGSEDGPSIRSITAERKIQQGIDEVRAKSRAYLRPLYMNDNAELICQCCQNVMPFKLKVTGEYYFEATQIFNKIDPKYYQLRLALCPNCSAMYEHGLELDDSIIIDKILGVDLSKIDSAIEIPILILGKEHLIFFVEKHFFDIQVLVQKINHN